MMWWVIKDYPKYTINRHGEVLHIKTKQLVRERRTIMGTPYFKLKTSFWKSNLVLVLDLMDSIPIDYQDAIDTGQHYPVKGWRNWFERLS